MTGDRRRAFAALVLFAACDDGAATEPRPSPDPAPAPARRPAPPRPTPDPTPVPTIPPIATPRPEPVTVEHDLGCFSIRRDIPHPRAILGELADIDHDGRLDLVTKGALDDFVDVLLGLPGGSYIPHTSTDAGPDLLAFTLADFDGDGHLDFAATSHESESVALFAGAGDGTFARRHPPVRVPKFAIRGVAADFTGDALPELALPVWSSLFLLKNRAGRLEPGLGKLRTGQAPGGTLALDLDGDRRLDLVTASNDAHRLDVLMSRGTGTFKPVRSYPCGEGGHGLAAADLTGDGHLDLVMTNTHSSDMCVFRGDGRGGFAVHTTLPLGIGASALRIVDLTRDGRLDLVAAAWLPIGHALDVLAMIDSGGVVEVYAGDGEGGFTHHSRVAVGAQPNELWLVDTHGDGALDLVTLNSGSHSITVLTGAPCEPRAPLPRPPVR